MIRMVAGIELGERRSDNPAAIHYELLRFLDQQPGRPDANPEQLGQLGLLNLIITSKCPSLHRGPGNAVTLGTKG